MAWLCSTPLTNLWQASMMPQWLASRPCLSHCHKRHIVYKTERHCNTNTNTPRLGDTLGKPLDCVGLKANIAMRSLFQLVSEKYGLYCPSILYVLLINHFPLSIFFLDLWMTLSLQKEALVTVNLTSGTVWLFMFRSHQTHVSDY